MRTADPAEIRFLLKRGVQTFPRQLLKDLAGPADKRDAALEQAAELLFDRVARYTFTAPDPVASVGDRPEVLKAQSE